VAALTRLAVFAALALFVPAAVACGGDGGGSVRYAPTVVPIKHLDLAGLELTISDYVSPRPAFVSQYPAVVAEVNGQPVFGVALAGAQVLLELQERGTVSQAATIGLGIPGLEDLMQARADEERQAIQSTDPLEEVIDQELERQAVERLDLLGSVEDARAQAHTMEASVQDATPAIREQTLESLGVQGIPTANWASDVRVVEGYRWSTGLANMGRVCRQYATPATPARLFYSSTRDCAAFLQQERANADIVYYVRWAD
jgi:hypothetical protein